MAKSRMAWLLMAAISVIAGCGGPGRALSGQALSRPGLEDHGDVEAMGEAPDRTLDADDLYPFQRRAPQPTPEGREGAWLAVSNHNHTTYWDGLKPLTTMQQEAFLRNLDALVLTDHNTMRGCQSPEFLNPPPGLIMVKGMEWNAFRERGEAVVGHAGILGMQGDANLPTGAGLDEMLTEATRRDATIVINHPFTRGNSWTQPKPDPRAHAVEVWNGWWARLTPIIHNDKALAWWDQSLREGRHLTAVAGTDSHGHGYDDVARVVNLVFAATPDQAGILAGIRAGHVSLTSSTSAARLYLEADADGDGRYEAMMGDSVARPADGKLAVRARVIGGKGKQVIFLSGKGRLAIKSVDSADATIPLIATLDAEHDFVRAELRAHPHLSLSMTALSNPIYAR